MPRRRPTSYQIALVPRTSLPTPPDPQDSGQEKAAPPAPSHPWEQSVLGDQPAPSTSASSFKNLPNGFAGNCVGSTGFPRERKLFF